MFKRATAPRPALSHIVGLMLLGVLAPFSPGLSALALGAATMLVLVVVAVWETLSLRDREGDAAVARDRDEVYPRPRA